MAENITRCPKCHTSFRIHDAQLNSAKGSVRCGSCLHIFNAVDHLMIAQPEPGTPSIKLPDDSDDDVLISDNMESEESESFSDEFTENVLRASTSQHEQNLFERDSSTDSDDDAISADDSWALDLLNNDDSSTSEDQPTDQKTNKNSSKSQVSNNQASNNQKPSHARAAGISDSMDYNDFYNTGKFEVIEEPELTAPQAEEDDSSLSQEETSFLDDFEDNHDISGEQEQEQYETEYVDEEEAAIHATQSLSAQFLDSFEPDPVEVDWKAPGSWWNNGYVWTTLSIIAGLGLAFQFAWLNFDKYARIKEYRPHYAMVCEYLNCQLPPLIDLNQISARNLIVRPSSKDEDVLNVDFVLQNTAYFEQQFPGIELVFTNVQNQAVSARCFQPGEYLRGELAGKNIMPMKQPIHVALEIIHPGKQAAGYKIGICD